MRVVIDTNVIVSGLYDPDSPPGRILNAGAEMRLALCAPLAVRAELERVLQKVLGYSVRELEVTLRALPVEWIEPEIYQESIEAARRHVRDPDDAAILACALSLGCDLVSGDKDLQSVRLRRVRVWKPSELVREAPSPEGRH